MKATSAVLPHDLISETDLELFRQWKLWLRDESRPRFFARLWSQEFVWHLLQLAISAEGESSLSFRLQVVSADLSPESWETPLRLIGEGCLSAEQQETLLAANLVLGRAEEELAECFERPMSTLLDIVEKSFGKEPLSRTNLELFYDRINGEGSFQQWFSLVLSQRLEQCWEEAPPLSKVQRL